MRTTFVLWHCVQLSFHWSALSCYGDVSRLATQTSNPTTTETQPQTCCQEVWLHVYSNTFCHLPWIKICVSDVKTPCMGVFDIGDSAFLSIISHAIMFIDEGNRARRDCHAAHNYPQDQVSHQHRHRLMQFSLAWTFIPPSGIVATTWRSYDVLHNAHGYLIESYRRILTLIMIDWR